MVVPVMTLAYNASVVDMPSYVNTMTPMANVHSATANNPPGMVCRHEDVTANSGPQKTPSPRKEMTTINSFPARGACFVGQMSPYPTLFWKEWSTYRTMESILFGQGEMR